MLMPRLSMVIPRRGFELPFHRAHLAPKGKRQMFAVLSILVFPLCGAAFYVAKINEHKRKEREKIEGPGFYKKMPRYIKPFPWGDGQTPFFSAMAQYWGFEPPEYDRERAYATRNKKLE